jgi:hypothetical protein
MSTAVAAARAPHRVPRRARAASPAPAPGAEGTPRTLINGGYIAGPVYDHAFFILSPLLALAVGALAVQAGGYDTFLAGHNANGALLRIALPTFLSTAFTHAHLVAVFFRSHANRKIFATHPLRFTVVPIALFTATLLSPWAFVAASVLTVWWDVYHSSLQTFGLGRIYDQRHGNDPEAGRRADYLFNLLMYAGPVLAGVNLAQHLVSFQRFRGVGSDLLPALAEGLLERAEVVRWLVLALGIPAVVAYLIYYGRLSRRGYRLPRPKLWLYGATAFCSVAAWGLGSFGEAFLIMNFFHALQYLAIVWWTEKKNLAALFRTSAPIALGLFLLVTGAYGFWRAWEPWQVQATIALGNVVSLMHFWYDGFVWSVRKGQV